PLTPEVSILRADLAVKTCAFDRARVEADALVRRYQPVQELAARAVQDGSLQDRIADRLMSRHARANEAGDLEGRLIEVLKLDPDFEGLVSDIADLEVDVAEATRSVGLWRELGRRADKARAQLPASASPEAVELLEQATALQSLAHNDGQLGREAAQLVL